MPFPFELTRPWMLLGLLLAAGVIYYFLRSLSDFPRLQQRISLATRLVILVLLVLALSGLTFLQSTDQQYVVFLVDNSLSIGDENAQRVQSFLSQAHASAGKHQTAMLEFARTPGQFVSKLQSSPATSPTTISANSSSLQNPDEHSIPTSVRNVSGDDPRNGTNIAAALESAAGFIPTGYVPRFVLLTDGNETHGDVLQAALLTKTPVLTVPLPSRTDPEVQVSEVIVPAEVREGEPFHVEVLIHSNHADEGLIEVYRGDHKVISERRKLQTGENRFRFPQSVDRERLAEFTVRISGVEADTILDNNSDSGLVFTSGKPRILIIESDPKLIRELVYALEDQGIQTDVRPPTGMPESLTDLQNYELLILSNVPATALSQKQMDVARTYVQELGGGFMMLGGEQSFGLGGYYKSTLEEILPVRSDFEKEKEKPSLGMVLVIDKSGSMQGDKMEMAKSAARSAVELLGRRDQVAVIAFDGDTYVISPMQPVANKGSIQDDISRIDASGGTTMYPAMEQAYEILNVTNAKLKHVIILTDGVSQPGDFEGLTQLMSSGKITVSTVAVGSDSDIPLLETIARVGKGRHYATDDPSMVPQIFAKETVTASKSAIDEQPFLPIVIRATHALAEIDMNAAPFLLGYVITRPKPTSEVILATEKGDPLLVWWRYGLGMTVAFTSDAKSRWAAEWLTWPGYGKFWTQIVRNTMRKSDARGIAVKLHRKGTSAEVSVDAVDSLGRFLNGAQVDLTVIDPSLRRFPLQLSQSAPGRYITHISTPQTGAYHLEISAAQQGQTLARQSRGLVVGYSDELRLKPTHEVLLRQIAEVSRGIYNPAPDQVFNLPGTTERPVPLWPWLLITALLLFVLDVALRRIDFSLHWPFQASLKSSPVIHIRQKHQSESMATSR